MSQSEHKNYVITTMKDLFTLAVNKDINFQNLLIDLMCILSISREMRCEDLHEFIWKDDGEHNFMIEISNEGETKTFTFKYEKGQVIVVTTDS